MIRNFLHRVISYKKRIGCYVIKVEYIDGNWWAFVMVDAVEKHHNSAVVFACMCDSDGDFEYARHRGLNFINSKVA